MRVEIRKATLADARACAEIISNWIEATEWMPRLYDTDALCGMIEQTMPKRDIWVAGAPVAGYLSFDPETSTIQALYTAQPGLGIGKSLMDKAKEDRDWLQLYSHAANERAHEFYRREGFVEVEKIAKGGDGLPEIRMEWRR